MALHLDTIISGLIRPDETKFMTSLKGKADMKHNFNDFGYFIFSCWSFEIYFFFVP